MQSAGITVRPLVQMTGDAGLQRGLPGGRARGRSPTSSGSSARGWQVANSTLRHERNMLGSTARTQQMLQSQRLARTRRRGGGRRPPTRWCAQRLADLAIRVEAMRLMATRADRQHARAFAGLGPW